MKAQGKQIIYQVLEQTFENLAFIFATSENQRDTLDYDSVVAARISFSGPFSGILVLTVSEQILPEIAQNMLGIEDEIPLSQQHDAFKELLNVICGNLLPAISGKKEIFNISVPAIISRGEIIECAERCPPSFMARLELENGPAALFLLIDGQDLGLG